MLAGTSSEDEDDMYNSVARLKALQKQITVRSPEIDQNESTENSSDLSMVMTRSRRSTRRIAESRVASTKNGPKPRKSRRKKQTSKDSTDLDSDLEIVSVEDNNTVSKSMPENADKSLNDIILCCDSSDDSDDDNYDMNIKILWKSKTIHRLSIHRCENFKKIFEYFAELDNVSVEQVLITRKKKSINITDTPASIGLSVIDILEGGIVNANVVPQGGNSGKQKMDEDICNIKIQTANKQTLTIPIRKDQQFKTVIINCAKQLGTEESNIKLYFDGEKISSTDTPESLDLEQEACIDLRVSAG